MEIKKKNKKNERKKMVSFSDNTSFSFLKLKEILESKKFKKIDTEILEIDNIPIKSVDDFKSNIEKKEGDEFEEGKISLSLPDQNNFRIKMSNRNIYDIKEISNQKEKIKKKNNFFKKFNEKKKKTPDQDSPNIKSIFSQFKKINNDQEKIESAEKPQNKALNKLLNFDNFFKNNLDFSVFKSLSENKGFFLKKFLIIYGISLIFSFCFTFYINGVIIIDYLNFSILFFLLFSEMLENILKVNYYFKLLDTLGPNYSNSSFKRKNLRTRVKYNLKEQKSNFENFIKCISTASLGISFSQVNFSNDYFQFSFQFNSLLILNCLISFIRIYENKRMILKMKKKKKKKT